MAEQLRRALGLKLKPEEQVRKWQRELRAEERKLERQERGILEEELKLKRSIKEAVKRHQKSNASLDRVPPDVAVLANEMVRARKTRGRLNTAKAQLSSIGMQVGEQLAVARATRALQLSTGVMRAVSGAVKVPEISASMRAMASEMTKAGVIQDLVSDTIDDAVQEDEDANEEEIQDVIRSIVVTSSSLGSIASPMQQLQQQQQQKQKQKSSPREQTRVEEKPVLACFEEDESAMLELQKLKASAL